MYFSYFTFFTVSSRIPGPTVYISHFLHFSVFLAIFHVIFSFPGDFLIFLVGQFSYHISGPTLYISHFSRFSVFLAIFHVIQCVFLILQVFQCFSPYFMSYHVIFSLSFLDIFFPYLRAYSMFVIFHVFQCFLTYFMS